MYFYNVKTLDELKRQYRSLVMLHHPDRGGDTETMKQIRRGSKTLDSPAGL